MTETLTQPSTPKIAQEDFCFLTMPQPVLLLGIEVTAETLSLHQHQFKPGRIWLYVQHQTCGHACHQRYFIGVRLSPRPEKLAAIQKLCDHWLDSDAGVWGVGLDELLVYRQQLRDWLGVDCADAATYRNFEEAWYPVDVKFATVLATDELPADLDDLIEWRDGLAKFAGCFSRWKLIVLGENGD